MSIPIHLPKDNAEDKVRRIRLLHIWTDICAMALCEMPEGRSHNTLRTELVSIKEGTMFRVFLRPIGQKEHGIVAVSSEQPDAEEKLADICRRLKPYVA